MAFTQGRLAIILHRDDAGEEGDEEGHVALEKDFEGKWQMLWGFLRLWWTFKGVWR